MNYARGGRVAQFDSPEAVFPSALHFSGEGEVFPVTLFYEDDDDGEQFAKGGLAKETLAVKKAGRHGDTEIIHINKEELEELKQMWGEPTINPQTGQPEFFLKKLWKGIKKGFKMLAPLAAFAIPVIGPAVGTALGVGATAGSALAGGALGALSGGGLKGAALGALSGGLGASGAAGKLGGALGVADPRMANALGNAIIGGGMGAASGRNPLLSGLSAGAMSYLAGPPKLPANGTPPPADGTAPAAGTLPTNPQTDMATITSRGPSPTTMPINRQTDMATITSRGPSAAPANTTAPTTQPPEENWWRKDFLGIKGVPNYVGVPIFTLAGSVLSKTKQPKGQSEDEFFANRAPGSINLPRIAGLGGGGGGRDFGDPLEDYYAKGYGKKYKRAQFAQGGGMPGRSAGGRNSFAVDGAGTGRSDEIPAMLSDGEYVIDAETVALLGDGSTKAGAKRLDDFRVKIRKHKGSKLSKGKFSAKAKRPEAYMAGGRA